MMKKIINTINWFLLFSLPILLLTVNIKTTTIDSDNDSKALSTNFVSKVEEKEVVATPENSTEEVEENIIEEKKEATKEEEKKESNIEDNLVFKSLETKEQEKVESVIQKTDVFTTYHGTMSYYNAKCTGCSGITSTGVDVSDGKIYYYDKTYGDVRIVAAGTEIKKWSIIRIKNSSLGSNTLAIVLDRGGAIGLGKTFLIDMLTNTSESRDGIEKNITVEVIRNGP